MPIKSRLRILLAEKEVRDRKRLSIKQLARETGLAESTLHSLANNTTQRFDAPILEKLCIYFGVSLSDLLVFYPEGEITDMDEQSPQGKSALEALKLFYPNIIDEMPNPFKSHQFIIRLAERHQREYIVALDSYRDSRSPFMVVHGQLARMLHDFEPELVELVKDSVPSEDIWRNQNGCSLWAKSPERRMS